MIRLEQAPRSARNVDTSIVPMINIVFLLLLYFLIAGRLTDSEGPALQLPMGGGAKNPLPAAITLHIDALDVVYLQGQVLDEGQLTRHLDQLATLSNRVVVRADAKATASALHRVLDACREVGISALELATMKSD